MDGDAGSSGFTMTFDGGNGSPDREAAPELADLGRYGRRMVRRFVSSARADDRPTFARLVADHLGVPVDGRPVLEERWAPYEHVNVQSALDAWLAEPGRTVTTIGMAGHRHHGPFGLGDLLGSGDDDYLRHGPRPGNLSTVRKPTGPDGETIECLRAAVLLVTEGDQRLALLYRGSDRESEVYGVTIEAVANQPEAGARAMTRLRELAIEHNVFRGQVVSFGRGMFDDRDSVLRMHPRQPLVAEDLILPAATFEDVRRQVVGVARNSERLRAAGQHLKRGLLLYGPPGVGKTHTVRYLVGELTGTTVVELSGE